MKTTNAISLIDTGDFCLVPTCEELGSCRSIPYKKTLRELKIDNVLHFLDKRVSGQATTLKPGKTGKSRGTTEICLPTAEATRAIKRQGHLNANFNKLLESEYGVA